MSNCEVFDYELVIKEHHLDSFGHVNHATYIELLEEARWEFITSKGFGLNEIQQMAIGPVVLSIDVQFLREIRLRQTIRIESQLISYDKKIATMRQTIFDHAKLIYTQAKITFGLFDMKKRKLIMPTKAWLDAIGMA